MSAAIDCPFLHGAWELLDEPVELSNAPDTGPRRFRVEYDDAGVVDLAATGDRTAQQREALLQLWERKYGS